jgi:hypothetical protein
MSTLPKHHDGNPKDLVAAVKLPLHLWPPSATAMGCLGLLEGQGKYGRANWREKGVLASVYYSALKRHMDDWFECADLSFDSKNPHLANALACLAIIVDAQAHDMLIDDRNYQPGDGGGYQRLVEKLMPQVKHLQELHKDKKPHNFSALDHKQKVGARRGKT